MLSRPCALMCLWFASSALRQEVENLTREQLESRRQSEKDRAALLAQMGVLELELEEQLAQHRGCARQAEEVAALKQEMAALDKHLRSQRQFMDVRVLCVLLSSRSVFPSALPSSLDRWASSPAWTAVSACLVGHSSCLWPDLGVCRWHHCACFVQNKPTWH